ncbi:alanine racemase [Nocardia caishijiensis]|uniref:Diaminopimelate decarboxylase n=1 Tax=Nocardia caishijiensis TaxID=184756 RepID=A0ABQ6YS99_9NOCA|nr:alanine racemase [Nocardia caishijiensis]KAF0848669.1 diaminopimelate decarboxylase [Nocardia caishijiensis]
MGLAATNPGADPTSRPSSDRVEDTDVRAPDGVGAVDLPTHCSPPLRAHTDEVEQRLLADPQLLDDIAEAVAGPFHVLFPERVSRNVRAFQAALTDTGVDGFVYFGKKANKAACVVRACAEAGAGVDVASTGELVAALAQGVRGADLMITGPAKSDELLWLAARHRALIAVDAVDELDRVAALGVPARVLLRVLPEGSTSRFGLTRPELEQAVRTIAPNGPITLCGFSFHLSGYDATARAEQAVELVGHCLRARSDGHPADTISIGGGFGVDYLDAVSWARFREALSAKWFHGSAPSGDYYPYHFPTPGAAMLTTVLTHNDLAAVLRENSIRVAVEPGRALLDRAGSSVFRVQGVKTRAAEGNPYDILTVDGTSLSLSEQWFDSEYLPDPVLWPHRPGDTTPTCVGATTCLESDLLSRRRIPLPRRARVGDLLIYPNTAGYQMDSNESPFHELPLPPKVVLRERADRLRWTLDATSR